MTTYRFKNKIQQLYIRGEINWQREMKKAKDATTATCEKREERFAVFAQTEL
jgi:outer membrane receptor for ferric coprogen and ferric-rhodotorulic acid